MGKKILHFYAYLNLSIIPLSYFSEMGNSQSDGNERIAHDVMKFIPFVNIGYNAVRAAVYAGKGNEREVKRSAIGLIGSTLSCVPVASTAGVAASAGAMAASRAGATAGMIASGAVKSVQPIAGNAFSYGLNRQL